MYSDLPVSKIEIEVVDNVIILLGYPVDCRLEIRNKIMLSNLPPNISGQINRYLELLAKIDSQLESALEESMAVKVGELNLNYPQHIAHLKSEGSRILKLIAHTLGLEVKLNKYLAPRALWISSQL